MSTAPSTRPKTYTEPPAHEALRLWFEADKSRTYAGMARVLDMSPATIAQWCRTSDPNRPVEVATMLAITVLTGIPIHAWLTPEEATWLAAMSNGAFSFLFERPKRGTTPDPRQMEFEEFWRANAPQARTEGAVLDLEDMFDAPPDP